MTISGSGFTGATAVMFGSGYSPQFFVSSDNTIYAVTPSGQGTVDTVVVTPGGPSATNDADIFAYQGTPSASGSGGSSASRPSGGSTTGAHSRNPVHRR